LCFHKSRERSRICRVSGIFGHSASHFFNVGDLLDPRDEVGRSITGCSTARKITLGHELSI
jgi:hypothetical protein